MERNNNQKKPIKLKICTSCRKGFPSLWKTRVKEGVKQSFCQQCWAKEEKKVVKDKKEKAKQKRMAKRQMITEKKLDQVTSRLIRSIYPLICHGCGKSLAMEGAQCGHFVGRSSRNVRFDPRNMLPVCLACNFYDQTHVFSLGKWIDRYWGEGVAEELRMMGKTTYKATQEFRNRLHQLYTDPPQVEGPEALRKLILEYYLEIHRNA
jgi:hypothetical protein